MRKTELKNKVVCIVSPIAQLYYHYSRTRVATIEEATKLTLTQAEKIKSNIYQESKANVKIEEV